MSEETWLRLSSRLEKQAAFSLRSRVRLPVKEPEQAQFCTLGNPRHFGYTTQLQCNKMLCTTVTRRLLCRQALPEFLLSAGS
jgi:hypothetical protein